MSRQTGKVPSKCCAVISDSCSFPQRYVVAVIFALGAIISSLTRNCTRTVISRLVEPQNISLTEMKSQCPKGPGVDEARHYYGEFHWSGDTERFILLSYYIGNILTHIPVGMLCERYGVKWPTFTSFLVSAIVSALTPFIVQKGEHWGFIGANVLLGLGQGGFVPAVAVILARWYPPSEHCRFGALLTSTHLLGDIITHIMAYHLLGRYHWGFMYYLFAGLGILWCIVFVTLFYNTPESHPFISLEEKELLQASQLDVTPFSKLPPVPFKLMLSNLPVWAYIVMHVGHDWVLYSMLLNMPIYLHAVLRFSYLYVLVLSVLPVVVLWITAVCWGIFSDYLLERNLIGLNDLRKMNTMISAFGPGILLLFSSYARCHYYLAIAFFFMCMCATGIFFSGAKLNSIDLCPNYAGTLMGISDGLGSLGAAAPSILNLINQDNSLLQWRNMFWVDFTVISSAAIIYLLFGSSKIQSFNDSGRSESLNWKETT